MIEVALALAIMAIGISSILVLFPVGINANKSAIANNNLADVAEYMISYLRAFAIKDWNEYAKADSSTITNEKPEKEIYDTDPASAAWKDFGYKQDGTTTRLQQSTINDWVFRYQQISQINDKNGDVVDIVDFSAIIKIWLDTSYEWYVYDPKDEKYKPARYFSFKDYYDSNQTATSDEIVANGISNLRQYVVAYCIEISWPAEVPYKNRESKTFHFEIFNDQL